MGKLKGFFTFSDGILFLNMSLFNGPMTEVIDTLIHETAHLLEMYLADHSHVYLSEENRSSQDFRTTHHPDGERSTFAQFMRLAALAFIVGN
jgi:hypothetical protein